MRNSPCDGAQFGEDDCSTELVADGADLPLGTEAQFPATSRRVRRSLPKSGLVFEATAEGEVGRTSSQSRRRHRRSASTSALVRSLGGEAPPARPHASATRRHRTSPDVETFEWARARAALEGGRGASPGSSGKEGGHVSTGCKDPDIQLAPADDLTQVQWPLRRASRGSLPPSPAAEALAPEVLRQSSSLDLSHSSTSCSSRAAGCSASSQHTPGALRLTPSSACGATPTSALLDLLAMPKGTGELGGTSSPGRHYNLAPQEVESNRTKPAAAEHISACSCSHGNVLQSGLSERGHASESDPTATTPPRSDGAALWQDPRTVAAQALGDAVRRGSAQGLCAALGPALRHGASVRELEGALHVLGALVKRASLRDVEADAFGARAADEWRAAAAKLDALAESVDALGSKAAWSSAAAPTNCTSRREEQPLDELSGASLGLDALSAAQLRAAVVDAQLQAAAAAARLAALQAEALRRLA